jgi:uncharacterized membrane protein
MFCSRCGAENPEGANFCSKCGAELAVIVKSPEGAAKSEAESTTGLSTNVAGLLCYVLGWVTGIIFLVWEKKSTFVKFHAWQSIITFGILTAVQIILSIIGAIAAVTFAPGLGLLISVLTVIVGVIMFIVWIILIIQAGTGKMWKVPWAGDWAEKQISK